jgi:hypothetical protein
MMTNKVCNATVGGHGWMMALFVRDLKSSEMYTRCEVTYNVKSLWNTLFVGLLSQDFAILPSLCFMFVKFTFSKWGACQKLQSTQKVLFVQILVKTICHIVLDRSLLRCNKIKSKETSDGWAQHSLNLKPIHTQTHWMCNSTIVFVFIHVDLVKM